MSDPAVHDIDRVLARLDTFSFWMVSYLQEHNLLAMDALKKARARIEELTNETTQS